jgi:hypothetical protein
MEGSVISFKNIPTTVDTRHTLEKANDLLCLAMVPDVSTLFTALTHAQRAMYGIATTERAKAPAAP